MMRRCNMTSTLKKFSLWAAILAVGTACWAEALLYDTFADGSRAETNLPNESAVWFSHPDYLTMSEGSLAINQLDIAESSKMWTYFAPNGHPVTLAVGDQLIATIEFTPRGAMYSTSSKNFRFGIFYDPTDEQLLEDANSDDGKGRWYDSRGYAVQLTLSPDGTAGTVQVGKRTSVSGTEKLLSSTGAYSWSSSSARATNLSLDALYTLSLTLDRTSEEEMKATFTFSDSSGVIATNSLTDDGLGSLPIYTNFDQLFFRMGGHSGTADVLDYHSIKIEHISSVAPPYEGPLVGTVYTFTAVESCRTELFDGVNPRMDDNRNDNNKLSIRSDEKAVKSWIKFDINDMEYDPADARAATLKITAIRARSGTTKLSSVNDSCLDNIGWTKTTLTWNNAPGNIPSDDGAYPRNTEFSVDDLRANLDPLLTTGLPNVDYSAGCQVGDQFSIDVLSVIQQDTDGIVQFALHGSNGLMDFATHGNTTVAYRPVLEIVIPPAGADWPIPYYGQIVPTTTSKLKWTNPEPNLPGGVITCRVYFGKDPNRPQMDYKDLTAGLSEVALTAENFEHFAPIQDKQTYYWVVDCQDSTRDDILEGQMWHFQVNNNDAPVVNAGPDQVTWGLPKTIYLDGQTSDDGLPVPPGAYTVLWTQTSGPTVSISPDDKDKTSVEITESGVYEFKLTADDGEKETSDTVRIVVGTDACQASHLNTGQPYNRSDINLDCVVDLEDFALLIAKNWLDCTDTLNDCK